MASRLPFWGRKGGHLGPSAAECRRLAAGCRDARWQRGGARPFRAPAAANLRRVVAANRNVRDRARDAAIPGTRCRRFPKAGGGRLVCPPAREGCGHFGHPAPRIPKGRRQAPGMPAIGQEMRPYRASIAANFRKLAVRYQFVRLQRKDAVMSSTCRRISHSHHAGSRFSAAALRKSVPARWRNPDSSLKQVLVSSGKIRIPPGENPRPALPSCEVRSNLGRGFRWIRRLHSAPREAPIAAQPQGRRCGWYHERYR